MLLVVLLFFTVQNISYLNDQYSDNAEGSFYQLANVLALKPASATCLIGTGGACCDGDSCDYANTTNYGNDVSGQTITCCGRHSTYAGKKSGASGS